MLLILQIFTARCAFPAALAVYLRFYRTVRPVMRFRLALVATSFLVCSRNSLCIGEDQLYRRRGIYSRLEQEGAGEAPVAY